MGSERGLANRPLLHLKLAVLLAAQALQLVTSIAPAAFPGRQWFEYACMYERAADAADNVTRAQHHVLCRMQADNPCLVVRLMVAGRSAVSYSFWCLSLHVALCS